MPTPKLDLSDVMLEATAEVQDILRETLQELALPHLVAETRARWAQAPEAMKEQFSHEHPEEYRALMDSITRR